MGYSLFNDLSREGIFHFTGEVFISLRREFFYNSRKLKIDTLHYFYFVCFAGNEKFFELSMLTIEIICQYISLICEEGEVAV